MRAASVLSVARYGNGSSTFTKLGEFLNKAEGLFRGLEKDFMSKEMWYILVKILLKSVLLFLSNC